MLLTSTIVFRLLLTVFLCGLIGLERESRHKPAGLRTSILVGLGSTLVMLTSIFVTSYGIEDPTRIAGGVITGVGFLCAGVIIHGRGGKDEEETVQNITTAATIWVLAALGLAIGLGFYSGAIATTVLVLSVLYVLNSEKVRGWLDSRK